MLRLAGKLTAALCMALLAAYGCGRSETTSVAPSPSPGEEPAAASKAPKGAIAVKVGLVLPMTGRIATYGEMVHNAVLLAAEDARAEGKVWPEIILVDNGAEQLKTVSAVKKFADTDKVDVIIGPVTSNNAIAAGDIAEAALVPLVTPTATNAQVTVNRKYVFRVCFSDELQGPAAANFVYDTLGLRKAAILVDSGESYSMGLGNAFSEVFTKRGGEIVSRVSFSSQADDFGGQITQLKLKKPDVVFMPAYYESAAKCVAQARAAGLRTVFVGTDGWDSPQLYALSAGAVAGNYFTTHFSPQEDRTIVKRFVQNFRAAYGKDPDALAALGYDAALVVFDAATRAQSPGRQALTNALAATKDFEGVTGKFSIDDKHNVVKSVVILETGDKAAKLKAVINP